MHFINQPWDGSGQRMGDHLEQLLLQEHPQFEIFRACVAFVKASGVLRLAPALQKFIERGGRVEIVAGVDEGVTSRQALELLMKYSTTVYVFNNPVSTFHPKLYLFEIQQKRAVAFLGSSNLTAGGLYTNYEANLGIELDLTVKTDRQLYENILSAFTSFTDLATGNAKKLNVTVLKELTRARKLADETLGTGKIKVRGKIPIKEAQMFPPTPVPPAPSIHHSLKGLIPKITQTGGSRIVREALKDFHPWKMFVMTLGERDARQLTGYSRDVFIPLAARDFDPGFWGWPAEFGVASKATVGSYSERRVNMLVRPVAAQVQVVQGVRLYYYDKKHEFRLNCGRLIAGAKAGDILMIQKSPTQTFFEGRNYEFEATVIPPKYSAYKAFEKECKNQVPGSPKRWGYL